MSTSMTDPSERADPAPEEPPPEGRDGEPGNQEVTIDIPGLTQRQHLVLFRQVTQRSVSLDLRERLRTRVRGELKSCHCCGGWSASLGWHCVTCQDFHHKACMSIVTPTSIGDKLGLCRSCYNEHVREVWESGRMSLEDMDTQMDQKLGSWLWLVTQPRR